MIATAMWVFAHYLEARRADEDRSAESLRPESTTPVFHPPGAVRLITPAEEMALSTRWDRRAADGAARGATGARPTLQHTAHEDIEMANFGARLAYPHAEAHDAPAAAGTTTLRGRLRRVLHTLLRSIDAAPFDLAWPPTYRRWPVNAQTWRADQHQDDVHVESTELRRAA
jgi:hypothetical protein